MGEIIRITHIPIVKMLFYINPPGDGMYILESVVASIYHTSIALIKIQILLISHISPLKAPGIYPHTTLLFNNK